MGSASLVVAMLAAILTFAPIGHGTAYAQDGDSTEDSTFESWAGTPTPGEDTPVDDTTLSDDTTGDDTTTADETGGDTAAADDTTADETEDTEDTEEEPLVLDFTVIPAEEVVRGTTGSEASLDIVYTAQSRIDALRRIFVLRAGSDTPVQVSPEDGRQYSWASWAYNGNKIVFTARDGEAGEAESIYWMNADGTDLELLLEVPFQSAQPKISSDGTTLLFSGRLPGTTFTRLYGWDMTSGLAWNMSQVGNAGFLDSDPSFSPDGTSVVFIDSQANGVAVPGEIAVMRSSGQGREQVTANGLYDTDPQITGDLQSVVSARYTGEGGPRDPNSPNPFQVVLDEFKIIERDVRTGAEIELTEGLGCFQVPIDFSCVPTQGSSYLPKYTPDDVRIGYVSILSSNTVCICTVNRDGSRPLVRHSEIFHNIDWFDWVTPGEVPPNAPDNPIRPDQLPDAIEQLFDFDVIELADIPVGTTPSDASLDVVFTAESRSDGASRLYLLEAGSSEPIVLLQEAGRIYDSPSFALGGSKIVFSSRESSGVFELWWMNRDGSGLEQLWAQSTPLLTPTMSADGRTLTFGALGLIFSWDLASGFVFNATAAAGGDPIDFDPSYGNSSSELVFTTDSELAVMSPTGQDRVVLTSNGATDTAPAISHDRSAVASARYLDGRLPEGGSVGGFAVIHHNRTTGAEAQLTEALPCHRVPARFACTPQQTSGFAPVFTPDDSRLGYVGVLSARAVCICTVGVDGANPIARWLSTDLAVGSFDWNTPSAVPDTAVLIPTRPNEIEDTIDFEVVSPDDVEQVDRGGLDVVFTATSRSDGQTRVYILPAGATQPKAVTPNDRKTYGWASWALGTTKIVYSVQVAGGPEEIWWMNRDGTEARSLIALNSSVTQPRISPDGTTLVFTFPIRDTGFSEIFALNLETGWVDNLSEVADTNRFFDGSAAFNLDGTKIALMDEGQVSVMNADGTQRRVIVSEIGSVAADPALNSDGSRLLYTRREAVDQTGAFTAVLASPLSPGERELTSAQACDTVPEAYSCLPDGGIGLYPIFTPDNDEVGYVSVLSSTTMCICIKSAMTETRGGAGYRTDDLILHRFDWAAPGSGLIDAVIDPTSPEDLLKDLLVTVAHSDEVSIERTRADQFLKEVVDISSSVTPRDASASADGSVIVFTAEVNPAEPIPLLNGVGATVSTEREEHYTVNLRDQAIRDLPLSREEIISSQLFVVNGDGTGLRQITTAQTEDPRDAIRDGDQRGNLLSDVSPDGRYVAFTNVSTHSEESFILRLDLQTGEVLSLTNATAGALPTHDTDPKWSPDGTQIAFVSDSWGSPEIWIMDADGMNARPVSDGLEGRFPAWSADGRSISFAAEGQLMLLDLDSGQMVEFASHENSTVSRSAWSSDGQFVAWIAFNEQGVADLYLRSSDGTQDLTKLTAGSAELGVDW